MRSERPRSEKQIRCSSGRAVVARLNRDECDPVAYGSSRSASLAPVSPSSAESGHEIAQQQRRAAVRRGVGRDPDGRVAGARGAVERGQVGADEAADEQLDQLGEEQDAVVERALLAAGVEVERVERDRVGTGQRQVGAADLLAQRPVLLLGVDDPDLHAAIEQPQRLDLRQEALARARAAARTTVL